ncbi:hypothetical protein M404DRAFT_17876 [Pisolithus tinctorius Marx 270]|uniref:CCHC-type domain-containing protein n=1 Tax=Pisolithus tinctorius Marx 270 TaxID=870435 RepID=A0A0C3PZU0_PISTI|nr:hypothetical protein M404DRAFT_17876 [Pisolithus tinctorius Marx 270]
MSRPQLDLASHSLSLALALAIPYPWHSPDPVSPFRGFSAHTSNTPTPCHPTAPILEGDPGNDGLGDDDDNNPDNDDPDNGPSDDNPDVNDLEDEPDFPDLDTEPAITVLDNLAEAIKLLACNAHTTPESSSRTNASLISKTNPAKVIFAQSYLKGMALEWFELDLLGLNNPDDWPLWMDSWREFVLELQTTFGPHNPVADTKSQLNHLHMKDNQHINNNNKSGGSGNNNQPKTGQEKAKTSNNNNSSSSPKPASLKPGNNNHSNSSKPEPSKLGKDWKLTPEEHKHHIEGNLCMFCGGPGHFADKCPKKARKAKACAAATTEATLALGSGSTPETKE